MHKLTLYTGHINDGRSTSGSVVAPPPPASLEEGGKQIRMSKHTSPPNAYHRTLRAERTACAQTVHLIHKCDDRSACARGGKSEGEDTDNAQLAANAQLRPSWPS